MNSVVDRIIAKFGSQHAVAAAIGIAQPSVHGWRQRGVIPARRQAQLLAAARARGIPLEPADFFETSEAA